MFLKNKPVTSQEAQTRWLSDAKEWGLSEKEAQEVFSKAVKGNREAIESLSEISNIEFQEV